MVRYLALTKEKAEARAFRLQHVNLLQMGMGPYILRSYVSLSNKKIMIVFVLTLLLTRKTKHI